uniref:Putative RNA-binding protein ylmH n=2 Tax=Anthurium amnicola TaxID=1678845 RepID=A0A1D1Y3T2_9ARAE
MAVAVAVAAAPEVLLACTRSSFRRAPWRRCSIPPLVHRPPPPTSPWRTPGSGGTRQVAVEALRRGEGGGEAASPAGVAEAVKNIIETARRASLRRNVMHTNFLTPPIVKEAMMALEKLVDIKSVVQGGYPQAERCRLTVGHPDAMATIPDAVTAVRISGNFEFEPCSHGDFLGTILGTGIVREKVGDILLQGEKGAQVLVVPDLVDFLVSTLGKVGNVPVSCLEIPLLALEYEPPRTNSFKTIEASLRVDALASAGFKLSRSKLVDLISNGDVRVNWSPVTKNGATLKTGDVISVGGKGRLKIGEIATTKKGKFAVELIRYL